MQEVQSPAKLATGARLANKSGSTKKYGKGVAKGSASKSAAGDNVQFPTSETSQLLL